jgi:hypothetical protein
MRWCFATPFDGFQLLAVKTYSLSVSLARFCQTVLVSFLPNDITGRNQMAKSSTERAAAYRKNRPFAGPDNNGERRLNAWITTRASIALERLAVHHGKSKREMLEKLICDADDRINEGIEYDTPEWNAYHNKVKPSGVSAKRTE